MGKIFKVQKFTTLTEVLLLTLGLAVILTVVYFVSPGLRVSTSKVLEGITVNTDKIDNVTAGAELGLPSTTVSTAVAKQPLVRIAEYAWNGNSGMIIANGGPRTTVGSLMEKSNINLEIVRIDGVGDLRNMLIAGVEEINSGKANPEGQKSAVAVSVMGDGGPYLITTTQQSLDAKFGKGKYHVKALGAIGLSDGEDKLIGPSEWIKNPKLMEGALVSSVIGDGDWVTAVNFAFANKVRVNPDVTTYDAHALNFTPSGNDDYINSVKELIASQKTGYTVPLKEVVNGKLTGKTIQKKIDGGTTWTPGDQIAFDGLPSNFTDVISTKVFTNQMATTLIFIEEWALKNDKLVSNLFKNAYIGGNQIKLYDTWAVRASEAVCKTYNFKTPKYWYDMFKGVETNEGGVTRHIGGSKVFNYADAMQYYGITDGNNRYKSVYEQVSAYLIQLNPGGFNETCKDGPVPYEDAVNLYFIKNISDIDAGKTQKVDYTAEKTNVVASGDWSITFATNSTAIESSSDKDLQTIYNLLLQAEGTKIEVVGHTDNTGNSSDNVRLSKGRADAVVKYLQQLGVAEKAFQNVEGKGDTDPIADNTTLTGRAKNRRVQIKILN